MRLRRVRDGAELAATEHRGDGIAAHHYAANAVVGRGIDRLEIPVLLQSVVGQPLQPAQGHQRLRVRQHERLPAQVSDALDGPAARKRDHALDVGHIDQHRHEAAFDLCKSGGMAGGDHDVVLAGHGSLVECDPVRCSRDLDRPIELVLQVFAHRLVLGHQRARTDVRQHANFQRNGSLCPRTQARRSSGQSD